MRITSARCGAAASARPLSAMAGRGRGEARARGLLLLGDGAQRIHLAVAIESVVAWPALAHLRRAVVHRGEGRVHTDVWARHWVGSVLQLRRDRADTGHATADDQRHHTGDA